MKKEYLKSFYTVWNRDGIVTNYVVEDMVRENYTYPETFREDKIWENNYFNDFKLTYNFSTEGKLDIIMTNSNYNLKLLGNYAMESPSGRSRNTYFTFSHSQLNNEPQKEYSNRFLTFIYEEEKRVHFTSLETVINDLCPYPKLFEQDKIARGSKYNEFQSNFTYFADGNVEINLSDEGNTINMNFTGTYKRDPCKYLRCEICITNFQLNNEPKKERVYKFTTNFSSEEVSCGYDNNDLKNMIKKTFPTLKRFIKI